MRATHSGPWILSASILFIVGQAALGLFGSWFTWPQPSLGFSCVPVDITSVTIFGTGACVALALGLLPFWTPQWATWTGLGIIGVALCLSLAFWTFLSLLSFPPLVGFWYGLGFLAPLVISALSGTASAILRLARVPRALLWGLFCGAAVCSLAAAAFFSFRGMYC